MKETSRRMFLLIILFALNFHSSTRAVETTKYDTMVVQPLATMTPSTTMNDVTTSKSTTPVYLNIAQNTKSTSKLKYKKRTRNTSDNDYNKSELPFNKSDERDQIKDYKITDAELLDTIYEMILKNRNVEDDLVTSQCPYRTSDHKTNNNINYKNKHNIHKENLYVNDYDANVNNDYPYQGFNKHANPIKVPLEAVQSPENGVLGRMYFRFAPIYNKKRKNGRL
ncbi:uncharacterized protein LOC126778572 [Nymphalis io]|uniref:uncharacterized protein LOC126778572 n=1 Tax=Inachis io TaxID=171585 RepID=UPI0021681A94|nr:uncharacterized protein LOC126778572 [Nymphalis io]